MTVRYWVRDNDGVIVEITDRINDPLEVTLKAEEGVAAGSKVLVHDPLGTFNVRAHRKFYITEDAIADTNNRTIAVCYTSNRQIKRGSPYVGRARDWSIDLWDVNTLLERRILVGTDCKRPEETDVERIEWLLSTGEMGAFADVDFVFGDSPVDMDECDYTGQNCKQVLDDCAQQSGKNYYAFNQDTGDQTTGTDFNDAHVWYGFDDREDREADVRISNVASDYDPGVTLIIDDDATLDRSGERVYSGVFVAYAKSYVMVRRESTAVAFAHRETTSPAPNVKSKTKAINRGNRYLSDMDSEEDIITCSITVPAALANCAQEGERIECRFEHLPGYEDDFTFLRIIERTVKQLTPNEYNIELKLAAPEPPVQTLPAYAVLYGSDGPHGETVYFARTGDNPGAGWQQKPKTGPIDYLEDLTPPHGRPFYGFEIQGTGNIDLLGFITVYGICIEGIEYTWTVALTVNGVDVATEDAVFEAPPGSNLMSQGWDPTVTATNVAVVPGDIIGLELRVSPSFPAFWRTPRGSGQNGERLEITGGSLA